MTLEESFSELSSGPEGISDEEAKRRLETYGPNELYRQGRTPVWRLVLDELFSFFPLLLLASSGLALFAHLRTPGEGYGLIAGALLFVVLLNTTVSFLQKRKVSQVMDSFQSYIPKNVEVIRTSRSVQIDTRDLVPGDVIKLREGDRVPGDAILIHAEKIALNEAILTGESGSVVKSADESGVEIYAGSTVLEGGAVALVYATGKTTRFGQTTELTGTVDRELTPLQKEIDRFARIISNLALGLGVAFFLVGQFVLGNPFWSNLVFAIGIIVANVPEGLLPTVTLALTTASERMAKKNALIKHLESVETLGSCTVICTDKTGTLTQNEMIVSKLLLNLRIEDPDSAASNPATHTAMEIMALCNNASRLATGTYRGDPLETALLSYVERYEDPSELRKRFKESFEKTFTSKERYMNKVYDTLGGDIYATAKGAPETVLERCAHIHLNGHTELITNEQRELIRTRADELEAGGLRVIGLAYGTGDRPQADPKELVFVGLVGMIDPPRSGVREAVADCHRAGIRVVIISGDTAQTVGAIAKETGISEDPRVIEGSEIDEMSEEELTRAVLTEGVCFARTAPEQKLRIVRTLQEAGETVAVTGDGVNDAPALKRSDLGIAIGSGTDVAKDAADIILIKDDFSTIVEAVREGRTIYSNIKRFVSYILTSNTPEIVPFIVYVLFFPAVPLAITVIQILSIDLFTDILPAIALGNERTDPAVMQRPPRRKGDPIVSWKTFAHRYGYTGMIETAAAFAVFFSILWLGGWRGGQATGALYASATGGFLATVIAAQIGNVISIRSDHRPFWKNRWMVIGIGVEALAIMCIGLSSLVGRVLGTAPFPVWVWLALIAAPLIIIFAEKLRALVVAKLFGNGRAQSDGGGSAGKLGGTKAPVRTASS